MEIIGVLCIYILVFGLLAFAVYKTNKEIAREDARQAEKFAPKPIVKTTIRKKAIYRKKNSKGEWDYYYMQNDALISDTTYAAVMWGLITADDPAWERMHSFDESSKTPVIESTLGAEVTTPDPSINLVSEK